MASLLDLSNELLIQISDYLYLLDLDSFAAVSIRISNLCQQRIERHQALRDKHRQKVYKWKKGLPAFLVDMCRSEYAPYVEQLIVSGSRRSEYYGRPLTLEDSATFRQASRASPWIPTNEEGQMAESAAKGDWDPVLGVVLPALRNLRILVLHRGLGHFSAPILMRLASSPQQSTLMNLQHVRCNMSNGIGLMGAAPFLAFPSVQTALLESCDDDNFEWPSSLPRSHSNLV